MAYWRSLDVTRNGEDPLRHVSLRDHTHILHLSKKTDVLVLQVLQLRVTSYNKSHLLAARIKLLLDVSKLLLDSLINRLLLRSSVLTRRNISGLRIRLGFLLKQRGRGMD